MHLVDATQVLHGAKFDEALKATDYPCKRSTLHQLVAQKRIELHKTTRDGTSDYLRTNPFIIQEGDLEILSITTSPHKKRRKGKRVGSLNPVSKLIKSGVEKSIISFAASRLASTTTKLPQLHPLHHRRQLKKKTPRLFLVYPPGSPSMYNHKQKN